MTRTDTEPPLTDAQLNWLLAPLHPSRVGTDGKGFAHVEAWDIRRHLIRAFGFGGYSTDLLAVNLVTERETSSNTNGAGRPRWTVVYRCAVRLTVKLRGTELGHWHGVATGDATNQTSQADAHDLALKTADSQALKRAAVNLGDQFGLSLYNNGSHQPVVLSSLAHATGKGLPTTDPPVQPEPQHQPEAERPEAHTEEREKEYAAMMTAAGKAKFTKQLPDQFRDFFGHAIEEGTAEEYRQARQLMESA